MLFLNQMKLSNMLSSACWSMYLHMLLLLNYNSSLWFRSITIASSLGNETDYLALLKFKESISNDPYGILDSWNSSAHFCDWHGVTCSLMHQRVIELNLTGYHLNGFMSSHIANLTLLRNLILADNNFKGEIPQELSRLLHLEVLDLNKNLLAGEIPRKLINCSHQLKTFDLSMNNLSGKIPFTIGSLKKLQILYLAKNNLIERIPPSIGNLSSLIILSIGGNNLEGNIPEEICHMKNLSQMAVHENNLSGTFPSCLYNMSSLTIISTSANKFNGSLSSHMFNTLPNLQIFVTGNNQFSGSIPTSISNATMLQMFDISRNHFLGQFPNLGRLQEFSVLSASFNHLGGNSTKDLEFVRPLANSSALRVLSISFNDFGGYLPNFLGNFSTQLQQLYLGTNQISGKIPIELANLVNLTLLGMENNHLEGIIPAEFGRFQMMERLRLNGNKLSGDITFIGNLSYLYFLDLSQNKLEGNIPQSIGNCQKLETLDLSNNNLRGPITSEVFTIFSLANLLNLSQNLLSGNLPDEVGRLKNIEWLDISYNNLSGGIPSTIGECNSLEYLYLQGNTLNKTIPSSLTSLKGLRILDLSRNYLTGTIPKGLQNISVLEYLNVSFNMLDGEVPIEGVFKNASTFSVLGNGKLCGGILELHLPPCHDKGSKISKGLIAMIACVISFTLIFSFIVSVYLIRQKIKKKPSAVLATIEHLPKVSYQSLYNGTDGFSTRNIIGSGDFGTVYKGTIESQDQVVAIKVLNLQVKGAHKSFVAECNAMRNIRHRNLVKILTCCSGIDYKGQEFKAIVYEFMTNGSLENWLHPTIGVVDHPRPLSFGQRLNIISDVAFALHYLHYECEQVIIHRDLKPTNILLDDCFVARVSDFGLARILSSVGQFLQQASTTGLKGTVGYAPPEYGMGSEVSIEGDMYSFGILVLEILTGKRPADEMFEDDQNLHNYVKYSIPNHLLHIIDPTILQEELERTNDRENMAIFYPNVRECLLSLFRVALACSIESPRERMSMIDVIKELNLIKKSLHFTRIGRRLIELQTQNR